MAIGMIIFNPFYLLVWGIIFQFLIVLRIIWKREEINDKIFQPKWNYFGIIAIIYITVSFYTLFTTYFFGFIGQIGLMQHAIPLILSMILSLNYLILICVYSPTYFSVIMNIVVLIYEIIALFIIIPYYGHYFAVIWVFLPVLFLFIRFFPFLEKKRVIFNGELKIQKIYTLKFNFILLLIALVEGFLQYRGYSLIIWT